MAKLSFFRQAGLGLLRLAASRRLRWTIIVLALAAAAWLGWEFGWKPLQQAPILPAGITPRNPALDVSLLQEINNQRVGRVQHHLGAKVNLEHFFLPPTPSPTP